MDDKRKKEIREALVSRFEGLLLDHEGEMFEAYARAFREHDSEKPFVFAPAFTGKITIDAGKHKVGGKLAWSVRQSFDAIEQTICDESTPDMFNLQPEEPEGQEPDLIEYDGECTSVEPSDEPEEAVVLEGSQ